MSPSFISNFDTLWFWRGNRLNSTFRNLVFQALFFKAMFVGLFSILTLANGVLPLGLSFAARAQGTASLLLTQERVLRLEGKVSAVAINADESIIASAIGQGNGGGNNPLRVVLTDRPSMGRLGMIDTQVGDRPRLRFSPVADLLLIGGSKALELWSLPISPMDPKVPLGKNQRRWRVEFSGDDGPGDAAFGSPPSQVYWIASGALHSRGVVGGIEAGRPAWKPRTGTLRKFAFRPGLKQAVMVLEGKKELSLVNLAAGLPTQALAGHRFMAIGAHFGNSGAILSLDQGNNLVLWKRDGGLAESRFIEHIPKSFSIGSFSRLGPGHLLLTASQDGGGVILTPIDHPAAAGRVTSNGPESIAASPTGRYLAAAQGATVRLYGFSRPLHPMAYVRQLRARKAFQTAQNYVRLMDSSDISPQLKGDLLNAVGREPQGKSLLAALTRLRHAVEKGDTDRIRREVKRVLRIQPENSEAAAALRHLQDLRETQVFQRAREALSKGENKIAITTLAEGIKEDSRRFPEAMQLIRKAEAKRSVQIMVGQAREKMIMGQYPAAQVLVKEALQKEPRNPAALAILKEIDDHGGSVFDSLIFLLAVILAAIGGLAFLAVRYRNQLAPYLDKFRLDKDPKPTAAGARTGGARAAWAKKATEANKRNPPRQNQGKTAGGRTTRRQVIGRLLEAIEARIEKVRQADDYQKHTALVMGVEAELKSVHRQLDDPASDLGAIHQRLKAIASQLQNLRFLDRRTKPKKGGKQTLYDLLNLPPKASQKDIKTAYLNMIKQYHPDVHNDSQFEWVRTESERMSRRISEAYDVLSDTKRRARYDRELRKSPETTR